MPVARQQRLESMRDASSRRRRRFIFRHVGPGRDGDVDDVILSPADKPHNPMVNAGAIVCTSLIKVNRSRTQHVFIHQMTLQGCMKQNPNLLQITARGQIKVMEKSRWKGIWLTDAERGWRWRSAELSST